MLTYFKDILKLDYETFIVAEIGVNHNGYLQLAKELVDAAKEAGADAVKFQTYKTEELVAVNSPMVNYQKKNFTEKISYYDMLKKYELSYDDFGEIAEYCKKLDVIFFSKGYINQLDFLDSLAVPIHKIDSASIIYYSLIHEVAKRKKLVLLSTGMAGIQEISKAVEIIESHNCPLILLHCVSSYPARVETMNLRCIPYLSEVFKNPVGLSDHSQGNMCAIASVALGVVAVEKHFTLDNSMEGPDHKASVTPDEFRNLVSGIRQIEVALGRSEKIVSEEERQNQVIMRRSWHFRRDMRKSECVTYDEVAFIRPNNGLPEDQINSVLGMVLQEDVRCGDPINFSLFTVKADE